MVKVHLESASTFATPSSTISSSYAGVADRDALVATVTLDDDPSLNALSPTLMIQLNDAIQSIVHNPRIKTVILTGAGRAFCSGGELRMITSAARSVHSTFAEDSTVATPGSGTAEPYRFIRYQFGGVVRAIANSNQIFVAAVNGVAAGVGMAIALACDVIIASEEKARFVPAFAALGLVPEVGTSYFMTRRLGYQGAFQFFIEGKHVSAANALKMGMVQQVVPHQSLLRSARETCGRLLAMPPHAVEMTKSLLRASCDSTFEHSMRMEEFAEANCFSTRALPNSAQKILSSSGEGGGRSKM